jgi:hypothetical protein
LSLSEDIEAERERIEKPRGPVCAETVKWTAQGDEATFVMPPGADLKDIPGLLRDRGIDPDDWHVERVTVNEWEALASGGGPDGEPRVGTLRQMKAILRNRKAVVGQAVEVAKRHKPIGKPTADRKKPSLVVVLGDQQAPYQDEQLHKVVLRWLAEVQPNEMVLTGDTADFPRISRHRDRVNWNAETQECVNVSYRLLSDYCDAHPAMRRRKLRGNHDWRLESELMDRAERMAFLRPADRDGEREHHLYSIRRLLHLDELGIELVGQEGEDWRYGEASIVPGLVVRHEAPNEKNTLRLNRSIVAGHTHRQSIRSVTMRNEANEEVVRDVVETGCLCRTSEGLGYTPDPDWQAGFATIAIRPDGSHHIELATWRNGVLTWRGERWK